MEHARQLAPLSTFTWHGAPSNIVILLVWALPNYGMLIPLSVAPAVVGAVLGRGIAEIRRKNTAVAIAG